MLVLIAGPRVGWKTSAFAIPTILNAPGACLVTSNKRDVWDETRLARERVGKTWGFDPQKVANIRPKFWWNPLSYIGNRHHTNEMRADKLAGQFVTSARPAGARQDAYFDSEAENLISLLLLAAAVDERPITHVYTWLTRPDATEPSDLLRGAGYVLRSESMYALSQLPDKQREGVYGTARSLMGFLRLGIVADWVTENGHPHFDPDHFAASTDTLYMLSRDGEGVGVGPLVAGLTMAVIDALEERATASRGGRLPVPCIGVLDEAANICRLRNLDSYYSHFGSRGIILLTILQSWHQGAEVWGDHGIEKLWGAATVKIVSAGIDDDKFLRRLSELIGSTERVVRSQSSGKHGRSVTRTVQDHTILTPAEIGELPQGRALIFASGTPAVMVAPQRYFETKKAKAA